ncbi:MAG: 23S rRNA (uracil(1939)-C(5))-methyltransferase RlmD [Gammaproteobacteria bacterium]|nr:MAG: 23S rRNA (uracil(1939)-C(5))-methyltransferase RlmD [Gammaproteobacteria bacterium]
MSRRRKRKPLPSDPVSATIESLSHDGRGVTHIDGKATFIDGALPGEEIRFKYTRVSRKYDEGSVIDIVHSSTHRVEPHCRHFSICGGCSLQHMDPSAQIASKQDVLLSNLKHIGNVSPESVLSPLTGPYWGYRNKARLGARYVQKKNRLLVGFREKRNSFIADLCRCEVLDERIGGRLEELAGVISSLGNFKYIPQIEVAATQSQMALVFRCLQPFTEQDKDRLTEFGKQFDFQIYQQPGGPESITLIWPEEATLSYRLDAYDVELFFKPGDFTQVNSMINESMVRQAIELLSLQSDDTVLDLFCGIGNFTLPMARVAGSVTGIEGSEDLLRRASDNARRNNLENVDFVNENLYRDDIGMAGFLNNSYNKVLLDPPRSGAREVIEELHHVGAGSIVYVSCNTATLARDAGKLVNDHGYKLVSAGVMDMFPHTAHVESMVLFKKTS